MNVPILQLLGEPEELDDDDLEGPITEPAPVIDRDEYHRSREYREFWEDSCWSDPLDTEPIMLLVRK